MTRPFWIRIAAIAALAVQLQPLANAARCSEPGRTATEACDPMGAMNGTSVAPVSDCHPAQCPLMGSCAPPVVAWRSEAGTLAFSFSEKLFSDACSPLAPVSFDPSPTSPPPQA